MERIREASREAPLAGSVIFAVPEGKLYDPNDLSQWWRLEPGSELENSGRTGGTNLKGLEDYPVVNVTHERCRRLRQMGR